ncbi:MAG: formate/nitrite transporter family protein [Candidatus Brocadia sp. AMX2]|uniref:Nitrite transporter n=1 Tax=Candidatus Brocadia sinica JPN1 TaxID=1197129 RepID=A0ABQ0JW47_9BACT|nr:MULTISPECIES: formate/nitrite transporter family protein [Brocadia]KXK29728.1 MAG: formate/nitrite transporter protein [Candidatus Brocadia sinica]MBC6931822.1 formate/nitrite transporter family protein [Candidatus Brocadia sp.]MBL1167323.1 formate/nitrite transporter family protein [Candidatus Brocadia sp. AMX1]NOG41204.1 formate/nitrite transporter family protein [Planctomycetota bacterium]KAA0245729.1 MAG: formate/nitrite transporter family protein [Candidatus Brocadia sp. AMX2]
MLYTANVDAIAAVSLKKATAMKHSLTGFLTLSVMAGFYIGFGVILAFIAAAPVAALNPGIGKIVAGATFGIALSLVIVGGAELFTGYNLLIFKGTLRGTITLGDSMLGWFWTYLGNLGGSMLFALMVIAAGIFAPDPWKSFILKVATYKSTAPWWELFFRGIFCNWLVCLAIWSTFRCTSDSGKLIMIWWCLFAFITTGMEHSVANMTILTIANLLPHDPAAISWGKMFGWNLVSVTLGNIVGGTFFVTFLYWFANAMDERGARTMEAIKGGSGSAGLPRAGGSPEEIKDVKVKMKS